MGGIVLSGPETCQSVVAQCAQRAFTGQHQNAGDILALELCGSAARRSGWMNVVVRREVNPHEIELEVCADLTEATVSEFRSALYAELEKAHRQVTLNLEKVRMINSAALGAILLFQKKALEEGKDVRIGKISDELRKTIMAIRLDRIIAVEGEAPPTISR
jgi:anti-anti-sigma factor